MTIRHLLKLQIVLISLGLGLLLLGLGLARAIEDGVHGLLTFLLLCVSLFIPMLCFASIKNGRTKLLDRDFFQPGVILAIFYYIYIWIPAFHIWYFLNYYSNWIYFSGYEQANLFNYTLILVNVGMLAFGLGYRRKIGYLLKSRIHERPSSTLEGKKGLNGTLFILLTVALIVVGLIANLSLFSQLGGMSGAMLEYLSPSMFFASGIRISGILDFFSSFLTWGALLLFFYHIVTRRNTIVAFTTLLSVFLAQYFIFSGKRSYIAPLFVLPFVWHHYLRRWISIDRGFVYLLIGFVLMGCLVLFRIVVPLTIIGGSAYTIAASRILENPIDFYFNSPELNIFDMVMLCIKEREQILMYAGGWLKGLYEYNFYPVLYIVPRFLWHDKPMFEDIGQLLYVYFYGPAMHAGFSVGIFGVLYLFGGIVGLFIGMFVLGKVCKGIYSQIRPFEGNPASVFSYSVVIWILFMFLRFGTVGFTFLFVVQRVFIGVIVSILLLYFYHVKRHIAIRYKL